MRGFVRDPNSEKAKALVADGISLAIGDLFDRASIDRAMQGIRAVFSVQTSSPSGTLSDGDEVAQGKNVVDSAVAAGVSHLVYSSGGAAGKGPTGMGHFDSKSQIEEHVRAQSFAWTVIPPFLRGLGRRVYAAIFSFCAGVIPPLPMFGRSWL